MRLQKVNLKLGKEQGRFTRIKIKTFWRNPVVRQYLWREMAVDILGQRSALDWCRVLT